MLFCYHINIIIITIHLYLQVLHVVFVSFIFHSIHLCSFSIFFFVVFFFLFSFVLYHFIFIFLFWLIQPFVNWISMWFVWIREWKSFLSKLMANCIFFSFSLYSSYSSKEKMKTECVNDKKLKLSINWLMVLFCWKELSKFSSVVRMNGRNFDKIENFSILTLNRFSQKYLICWKFVRSIKVSTILLIFPFFSSTFNKNIISCCILFYFSKFYAQVHPYIL